VRRFFVLAILLAGCSKAAQPSRPAAAGNGFESTWRPAPDPEPKPPPAPVTPAPPPPAPPPDPAAEARRAEAARQQDEDRRRRAREREFALLPSAEKRRVLLTGDALTAKGLAQISNADLIVISLHPGQFPAVSAADLAQALAVYGDRKGAREHLASLDIADPGTTLRVRAAFGLAADATCSAAKAMAAEIGRVGLANGSDRTRSFVARHPELFPLPPAATPAKAP
jgi:hypothetical protein